MSVTYPVGLPTDHLIAGLKVGRSSQVIRTPMEFGQKTRRRITSARRPFTRRAIFTRAQVNTFDTWYDSDLGGGALPFAFAHPLTGSTVDMQFLADPEWTPITGGSDTESLWESTWSLEILP